MALTRNFESIDGAAYSFVMDRPGVSTRWAKVFWRGNLKRFYERMDVVAGVREGGTVVDCPAGAGVAFRALDCDKDVDYVAIDNSPAMLARARARAEEDGLSQIRFIESDATSLPLADASADLYLSYWGLHCFDAPEAALHECARVLRPGGRLAGVCFVRGESWRQRHLIKSGVSVFRKVAFRPELESWIRDAGFKITHTELHGPMFYFDAVRL